MDHEAIASSTSCNSLPSRRRKHEILNSLSLSSLSTPVDLDDATIDMNCSPLSSAIPYTSSTQFPPPLELTPPRPRSHHFEALENTPRLRFFEKLHHPSRRHLSLLITITIALLLSLILFLLLQYTTIIPPILISSSATDKISSSSSLLSPIIRSHFGAVATDTFQCSKMGATILSRGGNAVDAAVASTLCLSVMAPYASGIGGGGFAMVHMKNDGNRVVEEMIDFRDTAPSSAHSSMFSNASSSVNGALSIAVPGELRGLALLHSRHGLLDWKQVVRPAARLARKGFKIPPLLTKRVKDDWNNLLKIPGADSLVSLLRPIQDDTNALFQRLDLASTLDLIANEGTHVFYSGSIAKQLVQDIQARGGIMTEADLSSYEPIIRTPIEAYFHGLRILLPPPPSSGGIFLSQVLSILERYNFAAYHKTNGGGHEDPQADAFHYHLLIEAFKHAFAHRMLIGDPAYLPQQEALVKSLVSKKYAEALRQRINESRTFDDVQHYLKDRISTVVDSGTSHLSVVDRWGNAVSLTTTVNHSWGSKIMSPSTGILLNNQMNDFSVSANASNAFGLPPSEANKIEPGKRPLSSMSPTIVMRDGRPHLVIGGSGGPTILTAVSLVLLRVLAEDMPLDKAITLPRLHHQLLPDYLGLEKGFPETVAHILEQEYGHKIGRGPKILADGHLFGNVQAVFVGSSSREVQAFSDPRKLGQAAAADEFISTIVEDEDEHHASPSNEENEKN